MTPPGADTILLRHSELGTKSAPVQARMETTLATNVERMLRRRGVTGTVRRERGRIFIDDAEDNLDEALAVATDTFGVLSASSVTTVQATEDAIVDALVRTAEQHYAGGSFAVHARRAGAPDAHPFTSKGLEIRGGSAIWEAVEDSFEPSVDLDNPDMPIFVECRDRYAYVFLGREEGPGGFPLGTQGRTVPLVSGGIDSPVAAWEMMRRGCEIVPVYFDFEEYGGADHVARAVQSVRTLCTYVPDGEITMYRVPFGDKAANLVETVAETRMLSLRRVMFAVADAIADQVDAHSLVTGESIGQKSSQTGWNLTVSDHAIDRPVHRPLLNLDKQAIIRAARELGTYSTATIPAGCNRVAPSYPETHATVEQVIEAEPPDLMDAVPELANRAEELTISAETEAQRLVHAPNE